MQLFFLLFLIPVFIFSTKPSSAFDTTAEAQTNVEVNRIELKGVSFFPKKTIEDLIEISAGDQLKRVKVLLSEDKIQNYYKLHGYEEAKVQSKLSLRKIAFEVDPNQKLERVLEFEVKEGSPTRIGSIQFTEIDAQSPARSRDNPQEINSEEIKRRLKKYKSAIDLSPGDLFDQEKIGDARRAVLEWLAENDFVASQVTEVKVKPEQGPSVTVEDKNRYGPVYRLVDLEFILNRGDRVAFGFRGNEFFSHSELEVLVKEQKLLGLGKDYTTVIRARLLAEYHSAGFSKAEIYTLVSGSPQESTLKVTFQIREGKQLKIDQLVFDGNIDFPSDVLEEKFYSLVSPMVKKKVYIEKDVQKAAVLLIDWLKEQGYLAAKLLVINATTVDPGLKNTRKGSLKVTIYIIEGDQTRVKDVTLKGVKLFSKELILETLGIKLNEPLNLFAVTEGLGSLKKLYRDSAYLEMKILNEGSRELISYSNANKQAEVFLNIDEGPEFTVSQVEFDGLERTQISTVRRELAFTQGAPLKESQMLQTEYQLRKLGIFSAVSVRTIDDKKNKGQKIVKIILKEADRITVSFGPGLRSDLGLRFFSQFSYSNLWGKNHSVLVAASTNRRFDLTKAVSGFWEYQLQFSYSYPFLFGVDHLTFRPSLSSSRTRYPNSGFDADNFTVEALFERPIISAISPLVAQTGLSLENISQWGSSNSIDNQQMRIGTLFLRFNLDLRDNPLTPSRGFFSSLSFEFLKPWLGSERQSSSQAPQDPLSQAIDINRASLRADYYLPVSEAIVGLFSFRSGIEKAYAQSGIPLIKQYNLGGPSSMRGYDLQQIQLPKNIFDTNQSSADMPDLWMSYVNYRVQFDFSLSGPLKLALFVDAANLAQNAFSFFGSLLVDPGLGFHYRTPVGDVNLDAGFRVPALTSPLPTYFNPTMVQDVWGMIHFSVGAN